MSYQPTYTANLDVDAMDQLVVLDEDHGKRIVIALPGDLTSHDDPEIATEALRHAGWDVNSAWSYEHDLDQWNARVTRAPQFADEDHCARALAGLRATVI